MTTNNQPVDAYLEVDTVKEAARSGQYEEVEGQPTPMLTGTLDAEEHEELEYGETVQVSQPGVEVMAEALYDEGAIEVDPAETSYSGVEGSTRLKVDTDTVEEIYEEHMDGFKNVESASAALTAAVEAVGEAFEQTYEGPANVSTPLASRTRNLVGRNPDVEVSEPAAKETSDAYGAVAFTPVNMQTQGLEETADQTLEPETKETKEESGGLMSKLGF